MILIHNKYNFGDHVEYEKPNLTSTKWSPLKGYILGIEYVAAPNLHGDIWSRGFTDDRISYGIISEEQYNYNQTTSITSGNWDMDWICETNILKKI